MTDPEAKLAAAILVAVADADARADLEAGKISDDVADAAASFAGARSSSARWVGGMTPVLRGWLDLAVAHHAATGRNPTVTQLAAAAGRSRTAAQGAIVRLRALGRWPDDATKHRTGDAGVVV